MMTRKPSAAIAAAGVWLALEPAKPDAAQSAAAGGDAPSLVVLPLANLGGDGQLPAPVTPASAALAIPRR